MQNHVCLPIDKVLEIAGIIVWDITVLTFENLSYSIVYILLFTIKKRNTYNTNMVLYLLI